jgi:hypothetical protein
MSLGYLRKGLEKYLFNAMAQSRRENRNAKNALFLKGFSGPLRLE